MKRGWFAALRSVDARGLARAIAAVFLLNTWLSGYVAAAAAMQAGTHEAVRCVTGEAPADGATHSADHTLCCTLACHAGGALSPDAGGPPVPALDPPARGAVPAAGPAATRTAADHSARGPPAV